ncbi:hypothetical protein BDN70DRAFT_974103 [Pholiota conissans]|uniref:Uncharacterized protein n=1 Tax=Pholiota conissans TaxID=109636 RepID=A0A9P5YMQ7_9AGAR|nr:hypothetical protein BDN70DRAFT_974103 [Pholiota conissans]
MDRSYNVHATSNVQYPTDHGKSPESLATELRLLASSGLPLDLPPPQENGRLSPLSGELGDLKQFGESGEDVSLSLGSHLKTDKRKKADGSDNEQDVRNTKKARQAPGRILNRIFLVLVSLVNSVFIELGPVYYIRWDAGEQNILLLICMVFEAHQIYKTTKVYSVERVSTLKWKYKASHRNTRFYVTALETTMKFGISYVIRCPPLGLESEGVPLPQACFDDSSLLDSVTGVSIARSLPRRWMPATTYNIPTDLAYDYNCKNPLLMNQT